jgi:hypothetical protein
MIKVQITSEEKKRCFDFASLIINGGNQYNRFNKSLNVQIVRTYIGKLAEYVFLHFLHSKGVQYDEGDMFEIFEGQENADPHDFIMPNGKTVDIKTASLPFHSRIMVPMSQFHLKKDFYVGIKLNFINTQDRSINPSKINDCILFGYIERSVLEQQPTKSFGEGPCKSYALSDLKPISQLIEGFTP